MRNASMKPHLFVCILTSHADDSFHYKRAESEHKVYKYTVATAKYFAPVSPAGAIALSLSVARLSLRSAEDRPPCIEYCSARSNRHGALFGAERVTGLPRADTNAVSGILVNLIEYMVLSETKHSVTITFYDSND